MIGAASASSDGIVQLRQVHPTEEVSSGRLPLLLCRSTPKRLVLCSFSSLKVLAFIFMSAPEFPKCTLSYKLASLATVVISLLFKSERMSRNLFLKPGWRRESGSCLMVCNWCLSSILIVMALSWYCLDFRSRNSLENFPPIFPKKSKPALMERDVELL